MKYQVEAQHIRLRLTHAEFAQLLEHGELRSQTRFLDQFTLSYRLQAIDQPRPQLHGQADDWCLQLPREVLRQHQARLPCRDGVAFRLTDSAQHALEVVLDVDVRDGRSRKP